MNNMFNPIVSIFTGKGGTLRLAIGGSLISAFLYSVMEFGYNFHTGAQDKPSFGMTPPTLDDTQETQTKRIESATTEK